MCHHTRSKMNRQCRISFLFIIFLFGFTVSHHSHLKSHEHKRLSSLHEHKLNFLNDRINTSSALNLPDTITPLEYYIRILPSFEENDFQFYGETIILLYINNDTNRIILNSVNLDFNASTVSVHKTATAEGNVENIKLINVENGTIAEQVVITTENSLVAGSEYSIVINYTGRLSESTSGFYRSWYMNNGKLKWMGLTRMEPTYARTVFPCFDEPRYRTPFIIQIGREKEKTVISNALHFMTTLPDPAIGNRVWDVFLKTTPIPTYLIAICLVDLQPIRTENFNVLVQPNMIKQATYILNNLDTIITMLSEQTSVKHSLTKMNIVGVPDYDGTDLANSGLITFRERCLLYDDEFSTALDKQTILTTAVQKLSYYWFGNQVTPKWWSYHWVQEAITKYFKYYITSLINPSWRLMEQLVIEELQSALSEDVSKQSLNKIISTRAEIEAALNSFLGKKGCAILRMMRNFIGDEHFKKGLKKYLHCGMYHSKGVVTPKLFWNAINDILPRNVLPVGLTIYDIMERWTNQRGYPILTVNRDYAVGSVSVSQKEFLKENEEEKSNNQWWVPWTFTNAEDNSKNATTRVIWLQPNETYTFTIKTNNWILFNIEQTGYYRVNYDQDNWDLLINQLLHNHTVISPVNRAQMIDDAFALAEIGEITYNVPITLSRYLVNEIDYIPWSAAMKAFQRLLHRVHNTNAESLLKTLVQHLIKPYYHYMISEPRDNETHVDNLAVRSILSFTANINLDEYKKDVVNEFNNWILNTSYQLIPESKEAVLCTGMKLNGELSWNDVWKYYRNSNVSSEKYQILRSLGCSVNSDIVKRYLEMLTCTQPPCDIRLQDYKDVFDSIVSHPENIETALSFVIEKYKLFNNREKQLILISFFESLGGKIIKEDHYNRLQEFYNSAKDELRETSIILNNSLDNIKNRIQWIQKNIKNIEETVFSHVSEIVPLEITEMLITESPTDKSVMTTASANVLRKHFSLFILLILYLIF